MVKKKIKKIKNLLDVNKWKYVCPFNLQVQTPWGLIRVPRGWLSDGASGPGIIDLEEEAFMAHDRLYVFPEVNGKDGKPHRIGKIKADLIYGYILMRKLRIFHAIIRPSGLIWFPFTSSASRKIWKEYRRREKEDEGYWLTECMVPHQTCWDFPSWKTERAVWLGLEVDI
jgi:hypothetical protein